MDRLWRRCQLAGSLALHDNGRGMVDDGLQVLMVLENGRLKGAQ